MDSGAVSESILGLSEKTDLSKLPASNTMVLVWDSNLTLTEWASEILAIYDDQLDFSELDMEAYLQEGSMTAFLLSRMDSLVLDMVNGTSGSLITPEDLVAVFSKDADIINRTFEVTFTSEAQRSLAQYICDSGVLTGLQISAIKAEMPIAYTCIYFAASYWFIGILGGFLLITILLLMQCNRWKMLRTSNDVGITLAVSSGILLLGSLFAMLLPDLWQSLFGSLYTIGALSGSLLVSSLIPNLCVFGFGIVLILVAVIGKAIVRSIAVKRNQ